MSSALALSAVLWWWKQGLQVYEAKLQPIVLSGLTDHVFSIRERACEQVRVTVHVELW